jgi:hypothetical protein
LDLYLVALGQHVVRTYSDVPDALAVRRIPADLPERAAHEEHGQHYRRHEKSQSPNTLSIVLIR